MYIKISGFEKVLWTKQSKSNEKKYSEKLKTTFSTVIQDEVAILSYRLPLYVFQNNIAAEGYYTFPFCFNIPDWVPGSFCLEGNPSG